MASTGAPLTQGRPLGPLLGKKVSGRVELKRLKTVVGSRAPRKSLTSSRRPAKKLFVVDHDPT